MLLKSKQQNLKKITAIALAVLSLDQIVKFIVVENIFFKTNVYRNYNALFGLSVDFGLVFLLILVLVFVKYILNSKNELKATFRNVAFNSFLVAFNSFLEFKIALGLILGGILGNLADRFFYGYIIDYLNFFNLCIFNIADLAICFGAFLLSWKVLKK